VEKLLATGANVNHQNKNGWTPLMLSVNKVQEDITRILLVAGADITLKENDGDSVFEYAAPRRNKIIDRLLAASKSQLEKAQLKQ
ncbi:MAG: ankyrin repeat domain-containing protein, partial [Methylococcaceae bacterium]